MLAALITAAPSVVTGADITPRPGQIYVAPDWLRRPAPGDLLAVFPTTAFKRGIGGKATISCSVTIQGALNDCTVVDEAPAGMGFGGAAIALTPQMMMRPATLDGKPVVATVRVPINFGASAPGMLPAETLKRVITANIAWREAPSYADVAAAYPTKARDKKIGGRATLACDVSEEGQLKSCVTVAAAPKGLGFEAAAKTLAKSFRIGVASDADRKLTHTLSIHLPVTFDPSMLDPETRIIGKPGWVRRPSAEDMQALRVNGAARATLQCEVQPGGGLGGCKAISEDPPGSGVGVAAIALAPTFVLTTWTAEGLPTVGGLVRIPIRFAVADSAPSAPPK